MNKTKYVLLFIFCLPYINYLLAVNPIVQNYNRSIYKAADKNWSISQDNDGIMYFGNDNGLLEFDGVEWQKYTLSKNQVIRSVLAHENNIYTGGFEEFGVWTRTPTGKLSYKSLSENLPNNYFKNDDIWKIVDKDDKVYFQSFRSIFIYENDSIKNITNNNVFFLSKVYDELLIQEMDGSLFRLVDDKLALIEGSEIFKNKAIQTILPYDQSSYLIITSLDGLFIYDGTNFNRFQLEIDFSSKQINTAIQLPNGNYSLGTLQDGIFIIDKNGKLINHYNTQNHLQNNTTLALFLDKNDNIWAGLDKGIAFMKTIPDLNYFVDDKNQIGAVYTACIFADKLFIGTNQGLFYTDYSNLSKSNFSLSDFKHIPTIHGQVWDLVVIDNRLYCAQNNGLYLIDLTLNISKPYEINTGVFNILHHNTTVYLGAYTSLYKIDLLNNTLSEFEEVKDPIIKVEIDHLNNIWLEHLNKGVYKSEFNRDKSKLENYTYYNAKTMPELPYKLSLFKMGERAAFLGNNKFYIYDDLENEIESYAILDSLFKNISDLKRVFNIDKNRFWVATDNVLYKVFNNGHEARFENKIDIGLDDISLVNNFEKIEKLNDSIDLICLDKGFIFYNNNVIRKNKSLEKPRFISFTAYNAKEELFNSTDTQKLEIPYNYNSVEIRFFDQELINNNCSFEYKLDGLEEWSNSQKVNKVLYERLPQGKYTFWLRTVDRLGNVSDPISIQFEILNPSYQTVWAYIIYILLFVILVFFIWTLVLKRYRNIHLRKIRERESKRLKLLNDRLQLEVKEKDAELLSQTSSIIQKNELIFKIKGELDSFHDKYSNKNFNPLFLKINAHLNNSLNSEEDWKGFLIKFEQKHSDFFKYLKKNYPELTANDLKLCACLKLNLDSKEIASLMNVSVRSIENNRSRLRKKLNLLPTQNLNDFILSI